MSRSCGKWYVCFRIETPDPEPATRDLAAVGVDLGLSSLVASSTGEIVAAPKYAVRAAKTLRRAQPALARKRRGSRRWFKAKLRVARLHARVADQRRDFSHKLSRRLVDGFTHIAFEDSNTLGLTRGMLARSVHDAAWSQLVRHVQYKAASAGTVVVLVDPRGTSQTCPGCGTVAAKTLRDRVHRCGCGCTLDRDVAAARVILHRASFGQGHGPLKTPFGVLPFGTDRFAMAPSERIAA